MPKPASGQPADRSPGVVVPVPNPIPHTLEGRNDCFACHAIGAVDAPPVPQGHPKELDQCTTCHAVWLAPAIAAVAPPTIPHDISGREDCLTCHKLGTADAPRVPDNHSGLVTDMCRVCHNPADQVVGSGTEATATPAAPVGSPSAPSITGADSANGQVLFSANCSGCHGPEGEGTAIAPEPLRDPELLEELSDDDLATAITQGVTGGMPPFSKLSEQDVLDLIAFLRSWQ